LRDAGSREQGEHRQCREQSPHVSPTSLVSPRLGDPDKGYQVLICSAKGEVSPDTPQKGRRG